MLSLDTIVTRSVPSQTRSSYDIVSVSSPGKPVIKTEPRSSPGPNASKETVLSLGANRSAGTLHVTAFQIQHILLAHLSRRLTR